MRGPGEKVRRKLTQSVQFKLALAFFALITALLILLNTYPIAASRDIVFSEKESSLLEQAGVVAASLAGLDTLSGDGAGQVVELLGLSGFERVVVTDAAARIIYDTASPSAEGRYALFAEIIRALGGERVFFSAYSGDAFVSHAALPVTRDGTVVGAVYLCELDTEQAEIILAFRDRMSGMSLIVFALACAVTFIFTRRFTERIKRLGDAVRTVREGDYAHRITPEGSDELTELSRDFNSMTETLEKTEEQRRRFVSDASHELKTPLAAIRLLADSITETEDIDPATVREFVQDISSEAERLQRTTDKLLNLSRRDDGARGECVAVDVGEQAAGTLRLLAPLADKTGVTLRCEADDGCVVSAPEEDVYQIIFNLAENAVKYNVRGGDVLVSVRREGDRVVLTVEDTGIGIPEKDLPNIFSRFYRVDKARSRERGGSGLGLSIVHDAVAALGGDISVGAREGGGTRFTVVFPARKEADGT